MKHILIRNRHTRKPVSYTTWPIDDQFIAMAQAFANLKDCEVKTVDCDGSRGELAAEFKTLEGWRDAKV